MAMRLFLNSKPCWVWIGLLQSTLASVDHRVKSLLTPLLLLLVSQTPVLADIRVEFSKGAIIEPPVLNEGDELRPGERVRTGRNGVVILEYSWPSDQFGLDCIEVVQFGFGQEHLVKMLPPAGTCNATRPSRKNFDQHVATKEPFEESGTTYGDAKTDGPLPEKVAQSRQLWATHFSSLGRLEKSYSGTVVSSKSTRAGVTIDIDSLSRRSRVKKRAFLVTDRTRISTRARTGRRAPPTFNRGDLLGRYVRVDFAETAYPPLATHVAVMPYGYLVVYENSAFRTIDDVSSQDRVCTRAQDVAFLDHANNRLGFITVPTSDWIPAIQRNICQAIFTLEPKQVRRRFGGSKTRTLPVW